MATHTMASRSFGFVAVLVALAAGCTSTPEATPSDVTQVPVDAVHVDGTATETGSDAGSDVNVADAAPDTLIDSSSPIDVLDGSTIPSDGSGPTDVFDGGASDATTVATDVVVDSGCTGADACFSCPPVALSDYLNQCTTSACAPFNNATRLPLYDGGALPPIP